MKITITLSLLLISFCVIGSSNWAIGQDNNVGLIVGVLEHHHIQWPDWGPSSFPEKERKYKFQVRVLFEKKGSSWVAFKHDVQTAEDLDASIKYYPREISWFVAFDGKTMGQLKSTVPDTISHYASVGLHVLDPNAKPPTVGKFTKEFAGWVNEPCLRPLVLVSKNHTSDPQMWKPVQPSNSIIQQCKEAFIKEVGPVALCDEKSGHETVVNDYNSRINHIKTYQSKYGEYLTSYQLNVPYNNKCDEFSDVFSVQWFFIDKNSTIRHIGKNMALLDAGDYDNDGISEIIFWYSGYDEDGYILFYNHFSNHAKFTWNYH
jgi:hypothetical protein